MTVKTKLYDFTDLVLLIGTNPLPNYVVAKYFSGIKELKRIWLLYSEASRFHEGTRQYADGIEKVLDQELISKSWSIFKLPLSNISQAHTINKEVEEHLMGKKVDIKEIHLNYTGGTKAMAVHTYRTLERITSQWEKKFSASYLDARDFSIKFDNYPEKWTGDLRRLIRLEWERLFALHGNTVKNSVRTYFYRIKPDRQDGIMQALAELAGQGKLRDFKNWVNSADEAPKLLDKPSNKTNNKEVKETIDERLTGFNPKDKPELFKYLSAFPERDRFANEDGSWLYENFGICGKSTNTNGLKDFLTGKWLEAYVVWVLNKKIAEEKLERSTVITNYELTGIARSKEYEIDVLVANGYQLCGISCTTSSKIKHKGFEVILRSSQMGGDEARAVLVTLLDAKEAMDLENNLKASLGAGGSRFVVLGIDDLGVERMWEKLKKHIYD